MDRSRTLEESLNEWYAKHPQAARLFDEIISGRYPISLRLIDWLCTNYSKRRKVMYIVRDERGHRKPFDVHSEYKDALRCFHKRWFDPFCRGRVRGDQTMGNPSRLRQKNFFKWAITNGVLDYVLRNAREIEQDMSAHRGRGRGIEKCQHSENAPAAELALFVSDVHSDIPSVFAGERDLGTCVDELHGTLLTMPTTELPDMQSSRSR